MTSPTTNEIDFDDRNPMHHIYRLVIMSADPEQVVWCATKEQAADMRRFAKELRPEVTLKFKTYQGGSEKPHPALEST